MELCSNDALSNFGDNRAIDCLVHLDVVLMHVDGLQPTRSNRQLLGKQTPTVCLERIVWNGLLD